MTSDQRSHLLYRYLIDAASGRFPPVDGVAEIVPNDAWGTSAVVEFTGHAVVVTDRPTGDVERLRPDGFGAATQPEVLRFLAGPGGTVGSLDAVLVRFGGGGSILLPDTDAYDGHPRVIRARHHRRDVAVYGDERGLVCVGSGLVGRTEVSIEVTRSGAGAGRSLLAAVVEGLPRDRPVFAQVAPGNAASLRAFLACGFVPIGSEVLIDPD